ncbi:MAG: hypothetical protein DMF93_23315 [Acidobacteria bacterium]|nr:MAG: hypothetical protein DMF93_23315 [Acidobacteriota bacterium]
MRIALRVCSVWLLVLAAASSARAEESLQIVPLIHANRVVVSFELKDAYNDAVREAIASGLRTTFTYELELRVRGWVDRTIGTTIVATTDRYENLTRRHTLTRTVDGRVEEVLVTEDDGVVQAWLTKWTRVPLADIAKLDASRDYYVRVTTHAHPVGGSLLGTTKVREQHFADRPAGLVDHAFAIVADIEALEAGSRNRLDDAHAHDGVSLRALRNLSRLAAGGNHMTVLPADLVEVDVLVEVAHRVPAQEREGFGRRQQVPQHLETNRRILLSLFPEHVDHLAVDSQRAIRASAARLVQDLAHRRLESRRVWRSVGHERRQHIVRVEQQEMARSLQLHDVQFLGDQLPQD